jgi:hypothetical protein
MEITRRQFAKGLGAAALTATAAGVELPAFAALADSAPALPLRDQFTTGAV